MDSFDVIIIGAGPAGLRCAETLGGSGKKILVLEKNQVIGPKPCGGLMTLEGLNYLDTKIGEEKFSRLCMYSKSSRHLINLGKKPLHTISRERLGDALQKKLSAFDNISIRTGCRVKKIGIDYVVAGDEQLGFDYLVGADGSSSIVRRHLGLKSDKMGVAFHYVMPNDSYKDIELFFDARLFGPWYAWILPNGNYVSIGTGCDPKVMNPKMIKDNFRIWLNQRGIDVSGAKYEAHPLNYDYRGIEYGNVFLAGDAAGLINSFTGEGIHPALISGEEVGKKILDPGYNITLDRILEKKRSQDRIMNLLVKFGPARSFIHEWIIRSMERGILKNRILDILA